MAGIIEAALLGREETQADRDAVDARVRAAFIRQVREDSDTSIQALATKNVAADRMSQIVQAGLQRIVDANSGLLAVDDRKAKLLDVLADFAKAVGAVELPADSEAGQQEALYDSLSGILGDLSRVQESATGAADMELLHVCEDARPGSVDRSAGILRGVRVCGLASKNGRRYTSDALKKAAPLYEGVQVNVDHNKDTGPTSYKQRFGVLRRARFIDGDGIRADLHFPPNHELAEQVCFDAENNAPVGLSHDVRAHVGRDSAGPVVDSIAEVKSVDIVARPATNSTFFESTDHADSFAAMIDRPATESKTVVAMQEAADPNDSFSRILRT